MKQCLKKAYLVTSSLMYFFNSFTKAKESFFLAGLLFLISFSSSFGVTMNFSGSVRSETAYYHGLHLGLANQNDNKSFTAMRALLTPNLIIDDHFSLKSQWSLLNSSQITPNATNALGVGQGGYVFGDTNTSALVLSRAWLEWISDVGMLRIGRMSFSWGYRMVWDEGNEPWDDFQTTLDRIEYRLHLGHVIAGVAFSKTRKGSVLADTNDATHISGYLQYDNPESQVEAGILYENQSRTASQTTDLKSGNGNPYYLPTGAFHSGTPYALASGYPSALKNHVLDIFIRRHMGDFTFGGELGWITGESIDWNGDGKNDDLSGLAILGNVTYEFQKYKAFLEILYASGDNDLTQGHNNAFVLLHRNRRPGLILGRELLGNANGNTVAQGSCVAYSSENTFSGCLTFRPGFRINWSPTLASGIEVIVAKKASVPAGQSNDLGVEIDLGAEYAVYQNFDLGLNFAYLFAGDGLLVTSPQNVFAVRGTATVRF